MAVSSNKDVFVIQALKSNTRTIPHFDKSILQSLIFVNDSQSDPFR